MSVQWGCTTRGIAQASRFTTLGAELRHSDYTTGHRQNPRLRRENGGIAAKPEPSPEFARTARQEFT